METNSREPIELDPQLRALFERGHTHVAEEPFATALARRIAADRRRRRLVARGVKVAALGAVALLSPWLVAGSQLVSAGLDGLFELAARWLSTPGGWLTAALCSVVAFIFVLWRGPATR